MNIDQFFLGFTSAVYLFTGLALLSGLGFIAIHATRAVIFLWRSFRDASSDERLVYVILFVVGISPLLVLWGVGMPWSVAVGVAAAGSVVGILCAPYIGWRYREQGILKAAGASLCGPAIGAYSSISLMAFVCTLLSD